MLFFHICLKQDTHFLLQEAWCSRPTPSSGLDIFRLMVGISPSRCHLLTLPSSHSSQIQHPVSCLGGALAPTAQLLRTFYLFYLYLSRLYLFAEAMFKGDHLFQVFPGKPGHKSSGPLPPFPCLLVHSACGAFVGSTWSVSVCSPRLWATRGHRWCFCSWDPSIWQRAWPTAGSADWIWILLLVLLLPGRTLGRRHLFSISPWHLKIFPSKLSHLDSFHVSCHNISSGIGDTGRPGFKFQLPSHLVKVDLTRL